MKRTVAILALLISTQTVQARMGETWSQCYARYGESASREVDEGEALSSWIKKGFQVTCFFKDGRICDAIFFIKPGQYSFNEEFSEAELQALLEANSQGLEWSVEGNPYNRKWTRTDGTIAEHDGVKNTFVICTPEALARSQNKTTEKEKRNLDEF